MGNTVYVSQTQENKNATATYTGYLVTSAITTGAAVANTVSRTIFNNSTGIIYITKGTSTGVSLSTGASSIVMTSAVFNPLVLDPWTGSFNMQSTTAASRAVVVETIYMTWAST